MSPLEFGYILALGGVLQGVLLVLVQGVYNKRSSLGIKLDALRTEVATRDVATRAWVSERLAQMEADSIARDTSLHIKITSLKDDPAFVSKLSEAVAVAVVQRLVEHKAVRQEAALLEPLRKRER